MDSAFDMDISRDLKNLQNRMFLNSAKINLKILSEF